MQKGSPDGVKMDPRSLRKIDGNSMPFQGAPRGPKSLQNLRKTIVFQGFGGWLLGHSWKVFWCPKAFEKSMQIPFDFWSEKAPQMDAKMSSKMHPKINRFFSIFFNRILLQNGSPISHPMSPKIHRFLNRFSAAILVPKWSPKGAPESPGNLPESSRKSPGNL